MSGKAQHALSIGTIVFFLVFLSVGLWGMAWQNAAEVAKAENRSVTTFPRVKSWGANGIRKYFRSWDAYIVDRMPWRLDIVETVAKGYYAVGFSMNPEQAIIGLKDWLFLGNDYSNVLNKHAGRIPLTTAGQKKMDTIAAKVAEVPGIAFLPFIAPNKHTIYNEYLPAGMQRRGRYAEAVVALAAERNHKVREMGALLEARKQPDVYFFHQTDTHWNARGAYEAFLILLGWLQEVDPQLQWPYADSLSFQEIPSRHGDLVTMLGVQTPLGGHDNWQVLCAPLAAQNIVIRKGDTEEVKPLLHTMVELSPQPTFIHNSDALYQRKVFFIRDSFGFELGPYLSALFSDVIILHYNYAEDMDVASFLREQNIDLVLYEQVEREW